MKTSGNIAQYGLSISKSYIRAVCGLRMKTKSGLCINGGK